MTDLLPITIRTFGLCQECGAVVHDEAKHFEWHVDQLPDDLPEQVEDPWEKALEKEAHGLVGEWDSLLRSAISLTADAIYQLDGDRETYIECIVSAAIRIRQMAPEGTKWREQRQIVEGCERTRLRHVLRLLIQADEENGRYEGVVQDRLAEAEASLHGPWLAAVEGR
jgi:hypothetical protein